MWNASPLNVSIPSILARRGVVRIAWPGPGEAREADIGIAAGKGKGVIFRRGEIVRHVLESEMVDALLEEIDLWEKEHPAGPKAPPAGGRRKLPVVTA